MILSEAGNVLNWIADISCTKSKAVVTQPRQEGVDASRNQVFRVEGPSDVGDEEGEPAGDERHHHHGQALGSPKRGNVKLCHFIQ